MNAVYTVVAVGAGGALGSMLRYLVTLLTVERVGPGFPWHTAAINIVGSFCIGLAAVYAQNSIGFSSPARAFVIVGVLGGFTTFSTFSYDTLMLVNDGAAGLAALYCIGSVALGVLAAAAGVTLARLALHAL